jgi:hypothetical protein
MDTNDLLHYVAVYGVILAAWVPVMNYFNANVGLTALAVFGIFIAADKIAHSILRV